eukprot:TRINITY_DN1808_c0_g1_i8.p1 TRINITY_DN1808_c0_g1~~TRINITY_DN1808_c0_g1_i8.p1  ORF type:complete len:1110 (+),score=493.11 TRINITY_DN1808_c0_g1_i8:91-3420(+)
MAAAAGMMLLALASAGGMGGRNARRHPPIGDAFMNAGDPNFHKEKGRKFTMPMWTDRPPKERGPAPYTPPKDWVYNTTSGPQEGKINVHLVSHSHDDTGWQVTVDQYFFGQVFYIIDTLSQTLALDKNRKFMFVETGFFARWWDESPESRREVIRGLVKNGQLEFVNGGWCMHDEASPYYVEMIDQTTRGHMWLKDKFGEDAVPVGTWQIDPFGHSSTNAWLIGAESGMDYLFWGRMDYEDWNNRVHKHGTEYIWQASESQGDSAQVFTGGLYGQGNQGYSTWFSYEGGSPEVQDDPSRHDYNVDKIIDTMVQNAKQQQEATLTDHQIWACGGDFNYQNADHWYHNMDKLIHYANLNGTLNVFYSTPTEYVKAKKAAAKKAGTKFEVRVDDVFPLANDEHKYWTGYFTSRPGLKRQVRVASNFLNAARQMEVFGNVSKSDIKVPTTRPAPPIGTSWTDSLEGTIGVTTHHDGMSGTEREDVSDDYELRISESHGEVEQGVALTLQRLAGVSGAAVEQCACNAAAGADCLNITACPFTTEASEFNAIAYNPLGRAAAQTIRLPVTGASWSVKDADGNAVPAQVAEIDAVTKALPKLYLNSFGMTAAQIKAAENKATHVVTFQAQMPPVGYSTYALKKGEAAAAVVAQTPVDAAVTISNDADELTFENGVTKSLKNKLTGKSTRFAVDVAWYKASEGGNTTGPGVSPEHEYSWQRSGAYVFRPNSSKTEYPGPAQTPVLKLTEGGVVQEVTQTWSDWAQVVYRLHAGKGFVEVEWTVGPIPMDNPWLAGWEKHNWGKEVIVRYSTDIKSDGTFYTDSNGLEMIKRQYNKRGPSYPAVYNITEPVAGNYYPITSMLAVQDEAADAQLAVLTDVAQGGASLQDGQVELMVNRRVFFDDAYGVQEPLNETMCGCGDINAQPGQMGAHGQEGDGGCVCAGLTVRGTQLIVYDSIENANAVRRQAVEELEFPATLAFTSGRVARPSQSLVAKALPEEIKLLTLTSNYVDVTGGKLLLRLQHLYSAGESAKHSVPVGVDLSEVFARAGLRIQSMEETQLTGVRGPVSREKFDVDTFVPNEGVAAQLKAAPFPRVPYAGDFKVTMNPMDVRTFLITLS